MGLCDTSKRLQLNLLPACEGAKEILSTIHGIVLYPVSQVGSSLRLSQVDLEQSKRQEKIVIRRHVNPDLDRLRHQYRTLPPYLTAKVQLVAERLRNPTVKAINIVYFPQLGFLVTASWQGETRAEDIQAAVGKEFSLQFVTEHVAYFKDPTTRGLDDEIGDIYADMTDLEIEIVLCLTDQILSHRHELCSLGRKLAEFDCLLCLAEIASEDSLVRPAIYEEGPLHVIKGRYSLLIWNLTNAALGIYSKNAFVITLLLMTYGLGMKKVVQ